MSPWNQSINPEVLTRCQQLADQFRSAEPFRHVVIDGFFESDFCRSLVEQFPAFDQAKAVNEDGTVGGKAVHERVRDLGGHYVELDTLIKSKPFRQLVGRITGIDGLRYDPYYFGGGTHENRHGQDLDPHVDFNYHPISNQHRRLNFIVYLNPEWQADWGGSLELHRDPRASNEDSVVTVLPRLNRAVIFETTESSWHGFRRIDLPEANRQLTRQSFALYYYTRERPQDEIAPPHSTIYVERPIPGQLKPGHTLTADDVLEIRNLLARRDQHLQRLYGNIQEMMARYAPLRRLVAPIRRLRYWLKTR